MITKQDKIIIKNLRELKKYGNRWLTNKFPNKNWNRRGLEDFLRILRATGSIERTPGSGRPRTVLTAKTVGDVEELVQRQEDRPQSHLSTRQISRELGISRRTVSRIVHDDQLLKCLKRRRAHKLTSANQRIVRGTRLSYCVAANQTSLLQTCGHQTHGPQPDWLCHLVNICKSCCKNLLPRFYAPQCIYNVQHKRERTTKIWTLIVSTMLCWYFYMG